MTEKIKAHEVLDNLFKNVCSLNKECKFITVQAENCTVYIPVINLDESMIPEFRKQFKTVYDLTQGN